MNKKIILPILLFLVSLAVLLRSAWIGDDAFITLRTVDNWVHGYGLVWNVGERVQAYTHPLWMFLLTGIYLLVPNGYLTAMILSLVTSLVVISFFLYQQKDNVFSLVFGTLAILLSKSFVDFSTSGLENPLTHLLVLIYAVVFTQSQFPLPRSRFFWLAFIAGLATLNRLDAALFFIPSLIYLFSKTEKPKQFHLLILGFLPIILWEVFSLFYYGFPFPNTAYAKLNAGVPLFPLMGQGMKYFLNSLSWDPITLLLIALSSVFIIVQKRWRDGLLLAGVGLYFLYIVSIGGDFMSGRFFSAAYLVSVFLLLRGMERLGNSFKYTLAVLALLPGILSPVSPWTYFVNPLDGLKPNATEQSLDGIADERHFYYQTNGLLTMDASFIPTHPWAKSGKKYHDNQTKVAVESVIGMTGYYAGPQTHIIDVLALGDPFLARLETRSLRWRIGHFDRPLVIGYVDTVQYGKNQIIDPKLAQYYDKLKLIISGDLWSWERIKTIWKMNTGQYNYLLAGYAD
jgi:arabinofuranosyltransferase